MTDVAPSMRVAQEEIFGPVLAVLPAREPRSRDRDRQRDPVRPVGRHLHALAHAAYEFINRIEAGLVMVNLPSAGVEYHVPFGGSKASSMGMREQGRVAVDFYTRDSDGLFEVLTVEVGSGLRARGSGIGFRARARAQRSEVQGSTNGLEVSPSSRAPSAEPRASHQELHATFQLPGACWSSRRRLVPASRRNLGQRGQPGRPARLGHRTDRGRDARSTARRISPGSCRRSARRRCGRPASPTSAAARRGWRSRSRRAAAISTTASTTRSGPSCSSRRRRTASRGPASRCASARDSQLERAGAGAGAGGQLAAAKIVGYTIGNDMSSRDIEGENPLYLPQAKVYDGCCALGPCVLVAVRAAAARDRGATCVIRRGRRPRSRARRPWRDEAAARRSWSSGCIARTASRTAASCSPAPASCRRTTSRWRPATRSRSPSSRSARWSTRWRSSLTSRKTRCFAQGPAVRFPTVSRGGG